MGLIIQRHATFYHQHHNFDQRFEALVSRIAADFLDGFDASRERCWIAERGDVFMGCVMVVRDAERGEDAAKLRLLLVDETARGEGVGTELVRRCVAFAREVGYKSIGLWTQSDLKGARRIYKKEGFVLDKTDRHASWGPELVGEHWIMTF